MNQTKLLWLWGWHAVTAALRNPRRSCHQILTVTDSLPEVTPIAGLVPVKILTKHEMDARFLDAVHQNIAVQVSPLPFGNLRATLESSTPSGQAALFLVLDQITDPHNVGALLRTAAAFQVTGVILLERHTPLFTGTLAKSASGALEIVPIFQVVNMVQTLTLLKRHKVWCVGLAEEGSAPLHQVDLAGPLALVMGSEGKGLRRLTRENCDVLARLPTTPTFSSLNVSNAGAIALYEARRTRLQTKAGPVAIGRKLCNKGAVAVTCKESVSNGRKSNG